MCLKCSALEISPLGAWFWQSSLFQVSSAGGFWKNKEVLSSQTPFASLSQTSDFQHESLLFTKPHLAEMEKIFQNEVNSTGGEVMLCAQSLAWAQGGTWVPGVGVGYRLGIHFCI